MSLKLFSLHSVVYWSLNARNSRLHATWLTKGGRKTMYEIGLSHNIEVELKFCKLICFEDILVGLMILKHEMISLPLKHALRLVQTTSIKFFFF